LSFFFSRRRLGGLLKKKYSKTASSYEGGISFPLSRPEMLSGVPAFGSGKTTPLTTGAFPPRDTALPVSVVTKGVHRLPSADALYRVNRRQRVKQKKPNPKQKDQHKHAAIVAHLVIHQVCVIQDVSRRSKRHVVFSHWCWTKRYGPQFIECRNVEVGHDSLSTVSILYE
jgi:hypothetical protein